MTDYLHTVLFHVLGEGASCTFEKGNAAMSLAKDLERQDYVVKVWKYPPGQPHAEETIYESDDWVPPGHAEDQEKI